MKIAIIGAGAAGIVAAITAKRLNKNLQIDIFDTNKSIGKKILASGNGRCNISNTKISNKNYFAKSYDNNTYVDASIWVNGIDLGYKTGSFYGFSLGTSAQFSSVTSDDDKDNRYAPYMDASGAGGGYDAL